MCGIVGAVAQRDVTPILIEGLKRLEYRGYDSAGLVVIDNHQLQRRRQLGKVAELEQLLPQQPVRGTLGIAHTRWATHGKPSTDNAHPHICRDTVAVVHNGIIENHAALRRAQIARGHCFSSETDTEVIANQIYDELQSDGDFVTAVRRALQQLEGAYALGVLSLTAPDTLIACRQGSPLVVGVGIGEYFIASDVAALLPVTQRFLFLEEGDLAVLKREGVTVFDRDGQRVTRPLQESALKADAVSKGRYRHYMLKEIFEQPTAIAETLEGRFVGGSVLDQAFGHDAAQIFQSIDRVQIVACGTSYHAGLVARYWFEKLARIPCQAEVASEFRYRQPIVTPNTLIVAISQSGETADTLAALQEAKRQSARYALAICNMPESALVRASDLVLLTRAGPEIGVASTKAFTTQLTALLLLVLALGRRFQLDRDQERKIGAALCALPRKVEEILACNTQIEQLAERFAEKQHALFLGRGTQYPIALEGALKLKEISYIHAEAYPAGELKHGPLALIDADMPVIAVAPNNSLLEKLKSNLHEVSARGGQLIVFMDEALLQDEPASEATQLHIIGLPSAENEIAPILYAIPLQLLAYHVAVLKGTDVDQPRNLAKSVTVE